MERRNIFQTDYLLITLLLTKLLHSNIMKRIFKLVAFVFIGAASVAVASCGDKDEPEDPTTVVDPSDDPADDPSDKDDNPSSEKIDFSSIYGRSYTGEGACNRYDGIRCNRVTFAISKNGKEAHYWVGDSENSALLMFGGKVKISGNRVTINSKGANTTAWDGESSSDDGPLTFAGYTEGEEYNYTVEFISADKSRIVIVDQEGFKNTLEHDGFVD